ncbi:MAG: HEAT repeat domain-containing protein [Phycisphaerae bacterium]
MGLAQGVASGATQDASGSTVAVADDASVESLFADFLHYARLGRFTAADAFARALVAHPELDPVTLLRLAKKDAKSVDTLLILIKHSTIGDSATRVLDLIEEGERRLRQDPVRIQDNIRKLGGDPQQEYMAIGHLTESGEYAVPWMLRALQDRSRSVLWPRVISALPKIGKGAVNPLVIALAIDDDDIRLHIIHALGEIGYPQAIPYLDKLIVSDTMPDATKTAAAQAVERIFTITGRRFGGSPADRFYALAERYYDEDDTVRADPRLDEANTWYWDGDGQTLRAAVVPTRIFGTVMSMRCCEEALLLENDKTDAIALWLASVTRREARLGLNTESGDPDEPGDADETWPARFPRALYFMQAAGPRYAHLVLERAVRDQDAPVALGAIEALRITAGQASLIGTEDYKQPLVQALHFPDPVVRTRAALALGAALPQSQFAGAEHVVPVLADALIRTGRREIVVVDPDPANLNRILGELRTADASVLGEAGFYRAINRARVEFKTLSAVLLATDIADPDLATAVAELRGEFVYAKTPIIVLVKPRQSVVAEQVVERDAFADHVDADLGGTELFDRIDLVSRRAGQTPIDDDLALTLALQSAETLRRIAVDGRTVFAFGRAEPALIASLSSPSEDLQTKAASVLALAHTDTSQRSIAHVALDAGNTDALRVAAFGSLAESAKHNGNLLEDAQIADHVRTARDERDLTIRTAASQALGAVNLKTNRASDIIRSYYGG